MLSSFPRFASPLLLAGLVAAVGIACGTAKNDAPAPGESKSAALGAGVAQSSAALVSTPRGVRQVEAARAIFHDALPAADVDHFTPAGESLVVAPAAGKSAPAQFSATLPRKASGGMTLESRGVRATITARDVADSPLELSEQLGVYPDVRAGDHLFRRVDARGVEDFVEATTARDEVSLSYDVALDHVAHVRFVGGVVELLDEAGAPRLRATAPSAIDADGVRREAAIDLSGCAFDTDPRGPWNRTLVAPGSSRCTVTAKVDARGLKFPVLLDPAWVATFNTVQTHAFHHMYVLPSGPDAGRVLILGGTGSKPVATELFDSATNSWSASSDMPDSSGFGQGNGAVMLSNGNVLVAGGYPAIGATTAARSTALVRKPDATWVFAHAMITARAFHTLTLFSKAGKDMVLAAGGASTTSGIPVSSAETYDPTADTWVTAGGMSTARQRAAAVQLADGRVLVAGGNSATSTFPTVSASTDLYAPTAGTWSAGPTMKSARMNESLVAPASGYAAVVAGGFTGSLTLDTAETLDTGATAWTLLASKLSTSRQGLSVSSVPDGRMMFIGGGTGDTTTTTPTYTTDFFDATAGTFAAGPPMLVARWEHASVSLGAKGILVTGGWTSSTGGETGDSELLDLTVGVPCAAGCASGLTCHDGVCCTTASCPAGQTCAAPGHEGVCTKPKGAACTANPECATGYCVEGFCCDGPCSGTCKACNIAGSEGTCVLAAAGTDPGFICGVGSPDPECGPKCDGTGKCGGYAGTDVACGSSATDGGGPFCTINRCSGFGSCLPTTNDCGLTCTTSVSCDESTKTCTASGTGIKAGYCVIDGACWTYGDVNPKNACQTCDPPTSKTDWTTTVGCGDGGTTDAEVGTDAADAGDAKVDAPADTKLDGLADAPDAKVDAKTDAPADVADTTVGDSSVDDGGTGDTTSSSSGCSCTSAGGASSNASVGWLGFALATALVGARRRRSG